MLILVCRQSRSPKGQVDLVGKFYASGFSLLELLVVMAITALLMGLVGPSFIGRLEQNRRQYSIEQFVAGIGQLPRWARITGERLSIEELDTTLTLAGVDVLPLPDGWHVKFSPALIVLPSLVCSGSEGLLHDESGAVVARFSVLAPGCDVSRE